MQIHRFEPFCLIYKLHAFLTQLRAGYGHEISLVLLYVVLKNRDVLVYSYSPIVQEWNLIIDNDIFI